MNYVRRFNKFISKGYDLEQKWWHRLIKVVFLSCIALLTLVLLVGFISENALVSQHNISIINDLRSYTKSASPSVVNTVPEFLDQSGQLACLNPENGTVVDAYYSQESSLREKAICNAKIIENIDDVVSLILIKNPPKKPLDLSAFGDPKPTVPNYSADLKKKLLESLAKETETRYCMIPEGATYCDASNHIIKYQKNIIYYFEALILAMLCGAFWYVLGMSLYYKILIYIIYGKK